MTRPDDPKGYYARLGVAVWATPVAIEAAFRARTRELQPDRKPSGDVAERQRAVFEAHAVLSDEVRRRAYDAESGRPDDDRPIETADDEAAAPWYRQRSVLVGLGTAAAAILFVAALVRAPVSVAPSPASALTPPTLPTPPRLERRVVTASGVNLRSGAGTQYERTSRVARGEMVDLLGPEDDSWVRVRLNDGRTGYIATRYLTAP